MGKDYYAVLGLPRNATSQQVRSRFLELARKQHPDRFQGADKGKAEREFQNITEAFNILSDPARRQRFDQELAQPEAAGETTVAAQAAKVFLRRGVKAFRQKNFREAAESFDRATKEDPRDAQAWHYLALACSNEEKWLSRAATSAARACELEPMNPTYLKLAGRLSALRGRPTQAAKYYQTALTWGGDDPEIHAALEELKSGGKARGLFGRS